MARFFGVGVRQLFAKLLKLAIQHQNVQEMVAINGQFVPINLRVPANQYHVKDQRWPWHRPRSSRRSNHGPVADLMMGAQFGRGATAHFRTIRLYVERWVQDGRFVSPRTHGDAAQSAGFPADAAPAATADSQLHGQAQQLAQRKPALKARPAATANTRRRRNLVEGRPNWCRKASTPAASSA